MKRKSAKRNEKSTSRRRFTPTERQRIVSEAAKRGLTAKQVQKEFGVTQVTYYLWRRKAGVSTPRGAARRGRRPASNAALPSGTRDLVRARVRAQLAKIVTEEIETFLREALGG